MVCVCDIANSLSSLHSGGGSLTVAPAAAAEAAELCEAGGAESWSMIWRLLCLSTSSNASLVTKRVAETTDDDNGLDQIWP